MPRVHYVKAARKDNPVAKAGEPYYWWAFRYGGKRYSKTPPRASQLTQSEFLGSVYGALEDLQDYQLPAEITVEEDQTREDAVAAIAEEAKEAIQAAVDAIREQGEEASSRRDSMPDSLQDSETGELLGQRSEDAEQLATDLEDLASQVEDWGTEAEADLDALRALVEEAQGMSYGGE